mmetsp:Transcript_36557/g.85069  ORF Transcript_36557/g.85069 Transcript_36557/m.85069 type:complete len:92 (+) Transcript_36557:498-773(+)
MVWPQHLVRCSAVEEVPHGAPDLRNPCTATDQHDFDIFAAKARVLQTPVDWIQQVLDVLVAEVLEEAPRDVHSVVHSFGQAFDLDGRLVQL